MCKRRFSTFKKFNYRVPTDFPSSVVLCRAWWCRLSSLAASTVLLGTVCPRSLVQFAYHTHSLQYKKRYYLVTYVLEVLSNFLIIFTVHKRKRLLGTVLYICPRYFVNLHITLDLLNILFRIWICKSFINKKLNLFYHLQRSWWTNTGYHTFQAHVFNWTTNVKIQTYINCSIIGIFCLVKTSICFFN